MAGIYKEIRGVIEMCLAYPGKVERIEYPYAMVNFGGARRKIRIDLLDSVNEGDYVLVHVGFAIQTVDQREAKRMEEIWRELLEM